MFLKCCCLIDAIMFLIRSLIHAGLPASTVVAQFNLLQLLSLASPPNAPSACSSIEVVIAFRPRLEAD